MSCPAFTHRHTSGTHLEKVEDEPGGNSLPNDIYEEVG
jgi:hypothetical protein